MTEPNKQHPPATPAPNKGSDPVAYDKGQQHVAAAADALGKVGDLAKDGAQPVVDAASDAGESISDAYKRDGLSGVFNNIFGAGKKTGEKIGETISGVGGKTDWWGLGGGILGVVGAFLLTKIFNPFNGGMLGGIVSFTAPLLLALPMFSMGHQLFTGNKSTNQVAGKDDPAASPEQDKSIAQQREVESAGARGPADPGLHAAASDATEAGRAARRQGIAYTPDTALAYNAPASAAGHRQHR